MLHELAMPKLLQKSKIIMVLYSIPFKRYMSLVSKTVTTISIHGIEEELFHLKVHQILYLRRPSWAVPYTTQPKTRSSNAVWSCLANAVGANSSIIWPQNAYM